MAVICPTVTAYDPESYQDQIETIKSFARRIHLDFMDATMTDKSSVGLDLMTYPSFMEVDIHLMSNNPDKYLDKMIKMKPKTVIIHFESSTDHMLYAANLHRAGISAGLALLQQTTVAEAEQVIHSFDQVLIFSGHLGYHGGVADLKLLSKVAEVKDTHSLAEIAWDGGINDQNAVGLVRGGVDILNVGGFIHGSPDPKEAYAKISDSIRGV